MRLQNKKWMGIVVGYGGGVAVGVPLMIAWGYAGLILAMGVGLSSGLFYESTQIAHRRHRNIMVLLAILILLLTLGLAWNLSIPCLGCA